MLFIPVGVLMFCCFRSDKHSERIHTLERRIRQLQNEKSALEGCIDELNQKQENVSRSIEDLEEELQVKEHSIAELQDRIFQLELN